MKRFFAIFASVLVAFSLSACKDVKEVNTNEEKEDVLEATEKEDKNELVIDIKKLEEVDEVTLKEAATALGFENENFFHAVANAMGISPIEMTKADIDKVHYIAVGPEADESYSVFVGYIDYVDMCFSEEGTTENIMSKLNDIVMMSEFKYDKQTDTLMDLGNFPNVEMFEIYDVEISDVSFIRNYPILALGYFKNNGITDVSSLSDFNPESLIELDFTGNAVSDWTPLEHIKEKVIVFYGVSDGMPITITLENMLEQQAEGENEAPTEDESDSEMMEFVDENGDPLDFSSLFE